MSDKQNEHSLNTSAINPEGSASLDESNRELYFPTTPSFPTPAPRPSLLRTRSSSTASRPHTRSRGPVTGPELNFGGCLPQTPPDLRLAHWRRIDKKITQRDKRYESFSRARANSDTSLLYGLGAGQEDLSFGELRTYNDSYYLAEPEPYDPAEVVEPDTVGPEVVDETEPVLLLVPEADMAGRGEEIALADPPPVAQAQDPAQGQGGQQEGAGVANEQPPPVPPRLPPNIKLDPNLPGVNLNITVVEWLVLQEQYNAENPQMKDNENIVEDDIQRDPNFGI